MTRFVHVTTVTVALLVFAAGCSRDRASGNATSAASVAAAAASVTMAPVGKPGLTEPAVRELVGKWAAAQSTNDFTSYETLYADRFTGVKRAGSLTVRQGRDDWMKDRKTMIASGLVVEATDVSIAVTKDAATVSFVQHYKSPRFEDVGPKQLVVIATPAGPRIAREEMLSSAIQMQGLGRKLSGRLHVAESGGVFLSPGVPAKAAKGRLSLAKPELVPVQEVDSAVDEAALSPDQRDFIGRTFTVYDAQGKACSTTVQGLSVKALVTPHFGTVQYFDDRTDYPDPAVAAQKRAETYFDLAGEAGRYLFGTFSKPCPGARWAVEGTGVTVTPKGSGADERAAITALHLLPQYRAVAADFAREHPEKNGEPWEKYDGKVAVGVFQPEKGSPLLVVGARGGSGCGDFWGALMAVFDVSDPARPASRGVADTPPSVPNLLAAVDLDADGELEFISGPDGESADYALIRPGKKGAYVRETFFTTPFLDCPC